MTDQATTDSAVDQSSYRLPRTTLPDRYDLTLTPDLNNATFSGEVKIGIRNSDPVSEITLNAVDLEIDEAQLEDVMGSKLNVTVEMQPELQRARFVLSGTAGRGSWNLLIKFRGVLNDKLAGFYRSTYKDTDGNEKVIAATQFEATDARQAFPCWDEPDIKATYGVTLVVDDGLLAIANTGVQSDERRDDGKIAYKFKDTIKMSTYLVAFVVGPLEVTPPVDVDGIPLRVVHAPGKSNLTDFALEIGAFSLKWFAEYYGIKYPGDKLDLIALPDFASGAMENFGAITFRETLLLADKATASRGDLQNIADVTAHEIAHMWFGDLVTMKWWNGIWLNEAFATFMEMKAVEAFRPEWDRWTSFGVSRAAAMATDALNSTRPVEYPVYKPEDCEGMFDILTYEKGASVVRMLEQYLGEPEFQKGITAYLRKYEYANTETTDLWDSLETETSQPARKIMDSWIFQGGFPIVSATLDDGKLQLEQQRFLYLPEAKPEHWGEWSDENPAPAEPLWQVPVMLRVAAGDRRATRKLLVEEKSATVELPPQFDYVVANREGHGFFRVRYSTELLDKLTANLGALSAIERFGLVSDTWAAVLAGLSPVSDFLNMARLFRDETDRNVWIALTSGLGFLDHMIPDENRWRLQGFARNMLSPSLDRLGWERRQDESELTSQLRGTIIGTLGTLAADSEVQARCRELHRDYLADRTSVDRDIVPAVINVVAHTGGEEEYDVFWQRYKAGATPQEEQRYLFGLAGFEHRDFARRTFDACLTDEVRTQNAPYLIRSLLDNRAGGELVWDLLKETWDTVMARFPDNSHVRMLSGITALSRPQQAKDVAEWFESHAIKQGEQSLKQHLERLKINAAFREREAAGIAAAVPS